MSAVGYFNEIVTTGRRVLELSEQDRPIIGTMCNFPPDAVILAAGAVPVRVDAGDFAAASRAEEFIPRDVCPVCKSAAGLLAEREGIRSKLALLVIPAVCDAKRKLPSVVDGVPVHVMQLPVSKRTPGAEALWLSEVERLAERVSEITRAKVERQPLRSAVERVNRRQRAFRELLTLRRPGEMRISGMEMSVVVAASFIDDIDRFTGELERLVADRRAAPLLPDGPRLMITGAPMIYPNVRLLALIESMGAHVVADSTCSCTDRLYHPIVPQEWNLRELMRAAAENTLLPTTCPCFTDVEDRLNHILHFVEEFGVQGVIYHNLRLCTLFQFETNAVREALQESRVPVLELQTDYSAEDTEQIRTRLQAFLEMVVGRGA